MKQDGLQDVLGLSGTQQGILFDSIASPESRHYHQQTLFLLTGPLNLACFARAWHHVVNRHAALRTVFQWKDRERPVQLVMKEVEVPFTSLDWRGLSPTEAAAALESYLQEDRRRGFDLSTGPVTRVTVLLRSDEQAQVLWSYHHLQVDGWSIAVLLEELFTAYEALLRGDPPALPPAPDFGRYIEWLGQRDTTPSERHWQETLRGSKPSPLSLTRPPPHLRPSREDPYEEQTTRIPPWLVRALKDFSREHGITAGTVMHAAWALLLGRYSGLEEVLLTYTVAARPPEIPDVHALVGAFATPLPLRVGLSPSEPLLPWLRQLQQRMSEQQVHAYTPLSRVAELARFPRDPEGNLFETLFVQAPFRFVRHTGRLKVTELRFVERTGFPLSLDVFSDPAPYLKLTHDARRYPAEAPARVLRHYRTLLRSLLLTPDKRLAELRMLASGERRKLVSQRNQRASLDEDQRLFHQRFEHQVELSPDAIAVACHAEQLTYRELNTLANRLAWTLRESGVGHEVPVAVLGDRSSRFLSAILAIFKAGGAYLPIDPSNPAARIRHILAESRAGALLVSSRYASEVAQSLHELPPAQRPRVLSLEEAPSEQLPAENLSSPCTPRSLAYIIYTSGSTGLPKGAMLEHRGMMNHLRAKLVDLTLIREDCVAQTASQSFDISVWQFLAPLLRGGRVEVVSDAEVRDPFRLLDLLVRKGVTIFETVPSLLRAILMDLSLGAPGAPSLHRLRWLMVTGEAVAPDLCRAWLTRYPQIPMMNAYGPTECSDDVSHHVIREPPEPHCLSVPIGRPILNTELYILGRHLEPVPDGVIGELYVGGLGVGRGYLGAPEKTAAAFLPHLFRDGGERLYKTGDLARYLPDGTIEFLGRKDHQVKLHGFRVETGEIEAALATLPFVETSVVLLRDDGGHKRLVGYVVPRGEPPEPEQIRQLLAARLPAYMLPSEFVWLATLPLTANGKLDRSALPAPAKAQSGREYVAPSTDKERLLADIFRELLSVEHVGANDHFIELGGDSITAIQVIVRARQRGLALTPTMLFQHRSLSALAAAAMVAHTAPVEHLPPEEREAPATPIQQWFFEQGMPEPHHYNQAVLLELLAPIEPSTLQRALDHLLSHHELLRARFTRMETGWHQSTAAADERASFEHIDLSPFAPAEHPAFLREATRLQTSLSPFQGPLLRAAQFRFAEGPERLLLVVHHLVVDEVSWHILLEDLQSLCRQLARGQEARLPAKTCSYLRWARRLPQEAGSERLREDARYWQELELEEGWRLPLDKAPGQQRNLISTAQTVSLELDEEETRALLREVPAAYNTQINDALLTALSLALTEWTGSPLLYLDLEGHGREELLEPVDLSRTVGWFTSIFPVALRPAHDREVGATLKSIKEQLRAIPRRGASYPLLRYLSPDPEVHDGLARLPAPQILFNYLGRSESSSPQDGLFRLLQAEVGPLRDPRGHRRHLLEVVGAVREGRLKVGFSFCEGFHHRETVARLGEGFLKALRAVITHCRAPGVGGYTPADFPLARLTQARLDQLLAKTRDVEEIYPLSPLQQNMLLRTLLEPERGAYVQQCVLSFQGPLEVVAFQDAWQRLVERYPSFRTSFHWDELTEPLQIVHRTARLSVLVLDWRQHSPPEQERRLEELLATDRKKGVDPSQAPAMRLSIALLGEERFRGVWTLHHLISDGWSLPLIFGDLLRWIDHLEEGSAPALPPPPPFREYIRWLQGMDLAAAGRYWRQQLSGFRQPSLLGERFTPPADTPPFEARDWVLSPALTSQLKAFSAAHGLTLSTLLQGAWSCLLSCQTGGPDVALGVTFSGRSSGLPGIESMVGCLINALPLRVQVDPARPLLPWLKELQLQTASMQQWESSPMALVRDHCEVPRHQPLFDTVLVVENYPLAEKLGQLRTRRGAVLQEFRFIESNDLPLTLAVFSGSTLRINANYDTRGFTGPSIQALLERLEALLEHFVRAPATALLNDVLFPGNGSPQADTARLPQALH